MNQALRWMLILGCLMLAVLEAPRSSALVAEDLGGPYREAALAHASGTPAALAVANPAATDEAAELQTSRN